MAIKPRLGSLRFLKPPVIHSVTAAVPVPLGGLPPFLYPKFWDRGLPALFDPPNLLLSVLAAITLFPAGRTQATELPPQAQVVQSVAVGWQAPFNPRFLGPVVPSGRVGELPVAAPTPRIALEIAQQQNFQQFLKPSLPSARALDTPGLPAYFRPADLGSSFQTLVSRLAVSIPSARALDTPALAAGFRPADLGQSLLFLSKTPSTPFAQYDWPLPTRQPYFQPADLAQKSLLAVAPTTPFFQTDWALPVLSPYRVAVDWQAPAKLPQPQTVAIASGTALEVPQRPALFQPADIPQNLLPLTTGPSKPFALYDWPLPIQPASFRAADVAAARLAPPTLLGPFAQYDWPLPMQPAAFRPADVGAAHFTPASSAPFAQLQWDLPSYPTRFQPADLANQILPPKETFTGFPFRQMDWPLPVRQAPANLTVVTSTTSILAQVASVWRVFILSE